MKRTLYAVRMFGALSVLFGVSLVPWTAEAEGLHSGKGVEADAITEPKMAAGAAEDNLQACMARIPKDASIGQRMIAEQSCGRDESERKPFEAVPGARSIRR